MGINLQPENFEYLFTNNRPVVKTEAQNVREIDDVYLVVIAGSAPKIDFDRNEISEVSWLDFHELEHRIALGKDGFSNLGEEYPKLFKILHDRYD